MSYKILSHIGVALGNIKTDNDFYLKQIEENKREQALHFMRDIMGRNERYIVDETQTSLSLAIEATKRAVEENKVNVEDIDMVICVTYTPEYTSPTMARLVLDELGGKDTVNCLDMNVNCTGMLVALDMADRYFETDQTINKIVVVQGDCHSRVPTESDSPFYGCLGDIGCAVILERAENIGIRSRHYTMDKTMARNIVYPKNGFSKPERVLYTVPGLDARVDLGASLIKKHYSKEQLSEMKLFCISQFAYINYQKFIELMGIEKEKVPYVGDKYGYTGACSPILALKQAIEEGKVKRGDSILMWTYGAGTQHVVLEIKY